MTELKDETLLRRAELSAALTEAGFPIATSTLATIACRGHGPAYRRFGRTPLYEWGTALKWARSRLSGLVTNTSEAA